MRDSPNSLCSQDATLALYAKATRYNALSWRAWASNTGGRRLLPATANQHFYATNALPDPPPIRGASSIPSHDGATRRASRKAGITLTRQWFISAGFHGPTQAVCHTVQPASRGRHSRTPPQPTHLTVCHDFLCATRQSGPPIRKHEA